VAAQLAARAETRLKETKDLQKVARELAPEANMQPAEMIKETGYIRPGDDVPDIGANQQFEQAISSLNNPNDVGDRTGVKGGFAIPIFVDKKDPRVPEYDEVKDRVAQAMKSERAKSQLEQKAREIAGAINNPGEIKGAGEKAGFEVATEQDFKLGATLGKAGTSPALDEAIFGLKEGQVTKSPIKVGESWVVIGATKRVEPDLVAFNSQRAGRTSALLNERQGQVFDDYIAKVQERLKQEGKITIYKDVLAVLEEEEPVAAPPQPQFPIPTK
jgi:peptidyl-prolyl cis-trans isomerase D